MSKLNTNSVGLGTSLVILLALLTALDAMAIDMYLPGMAAIADGLAVSAGSAQQTLAVFLAGLALGQFIYGPLLDCFGRRMPLMLGLSAFVAGSVAAALSPTLEWLLAARFVQALGAAAGLVAPRAVVSDRCDITAAARVFSLLMQVMMIAPVLAPMLGGWLLGFAGWRSIFWVLAALGVAGMVWTYLSLPETLPPERRASLHIGSVTRAYWRQVVRPVFITYTLAGGFVLGSLFTYISGSAFIFTQYFALSPSSFSYLFAANSVALIGGGTLATLAAARGVSPAAVTRIGLGLHVLAAAALCLMVALNAVLLVGYALLLAWAIGALGLVFGNLTALTLNDGGEQAGVASALMGTLHYLVAAGVGYLANLVTQGLGVVPTSIVICGTLALMLCAFAERLQGASARCDA